MNLGEYVKTPRFCRVKINAIFKDSNEAMACGYTEPTNYKSDEWHVRGKSAGENRMVFAAIKRDNL